MAFYSCVALYALRRATKVRCAVTQNINVGALVTTLPDMEIRMSSNTAQMSTIYLLIGLATIVTVMLIGPLYGRLNGLLLMAFCFLMMAVFGGLAPTWTNLFSYQALTAVAYGFYGCIESGEVRHFAHLSSRGVSSITSTLQEPVGAVASGRAVTGKKIVSHVFKFAVFFT